MPAEASITCSAKVKLKFHLVKNKYEIKHNKTISINEFITLITEKYEAMEL